MTLSAEDNVKLTKQFNKGFKRSLYWKEYKVTDNKKVAITNANDEEPIKELLDSSYQGVKRLFLLALYDNTVGNNLFLLNLSKNIYFQE